LIVIDFIYWLFIIGYLEVQLNKMLIVHLIIIRIFEKLYNFKKWAIRHQRFDKEKLDTGKFFAFFIKIYDYRTYLYA